MIAAITIDMTMTLGDIVVAGTTVLAVLGAYYAVKNNVYALTLMVKGHGRTIDDHDTQLDGHGRTIGHHGESIARLDQKVFGRRQTDNQDT